MSDASFILMRPLWLLGFVPLLLALFFWLRYGTQANVWERVVDPNLQPYVLAADATKRSAGPWLLFAAWVLSLLMLAGPVWEKQPVPVYQANQAEIIILDLSASMDVDDIAPSRLTRARFKLSDLLAEKEARQIGLIAFAERPYVISPLTEDTSTIAAFLPSLSTQIMPAQGSRLDLAIVRAHELLEQAGVSQGHVLYIGDQSIGERDTSAAAALRDAGHRLSVLSVGTSAGRPLKGPDGQFVKQANGSIVVPSVNLANMRSLAQVGGGVAVSLSANNADLEQLAQVRASVAIDADGPQQSSQQTYWIEYSPWLVWPLLFGALLLYRRGVLT